MEKIKLLALFGESSAGKDTIQHWLAQNVESVHEVISYTTRPPRDYEQEGKDYHFVTKSIFEQFIIQDQLLEFTIFNNWYYGTPITELDTNKINVGVFNPFGVRTLLFHTNKLNILPVRIQTDDKTRLLRSLQREDHPNCEEICRRFLADKKDFNNIKFDYITYDNNNNHNNYNNLLSVPEISNFIFGQK